MAFLAGALTASLAQASFVPIRADLWGNTAYTTSGGDSRNPAQIDITGVYEHSFAQWAQFNGTGGESAVSSEEGSYAHDRIWVKATAAGTVRSSAASSASYRFQVTDNTVYRLHYKLEYRPVVSWDLSLILVTDHTTDTLIHEFRDTNTEGEVEIQFIPTHVYSLYAGVAHSNLSPYSDPEGDKDFLAEATLTPVPEPMTLLALGAGALALLKRRR